MRLVAPFLAAMLPVSALAGPVPVLELADGVTSVPLNRDAALPAFAIVDGEQLVGVVHGMKGDHGNVPRLTVLDLNGNARIEMGRVTRADGTLVVRAGLVFYDEEWSPRVALEGGRLLRVSDDGPIETVASGATVWLADAKGRRRATSDATCTSLHDEKGSPMARICSADDGAVIRMERGYVGAGNEEGPPEIGPGVERGDGARGATAESALRFVDRKGRGTRLRTVASRVPPLAVANVGTIRFKSQPQKGGVSVRMLP